MLHGLVAAAIVAGAVFLHHRSSNWGENAANVGAIQATMVSSIPLPPTQRTLDTGVLTSEAPSPAPVVTKEKTEPPPSPKEVAIPEKITKPIKTAEKPTPAPPKRPIFPPFRNGWMRSMTFTPVSNISAVVACSSKEGAKR